MATSFFYIYIDMYKLMERPVVLLNAIYNIYRTQVSLGSGLWVPVSVPTSNTFGWDFTDVTLAYDDTN